VVGDWRNASRIPSRLLILGRAVLGVSGKLPVSTSIESTISARILDSRTSENQAVPTTTVWIDTPNAEMAYAEVADSFAIRLEVSILQAFPTTVHLVRPLLTSLQFS
jgi:hypothetical protein